MAVIGVTMRRMVRGLLIALAAVIVAAGGGLALVLSHGPAGSGNRGPATPAIPRTVSPLPPTSAPTHLSRVLCANWAVLPLPPGSGDSSPDLDAVTALSADDFWAVGKSGGSSGTTVHWDGSAWKQYPTPSVSGIAWLSSVAAVSATDIWAVGWNATGQESSTTLIEHWNGSRWSIVSSPNEGSDQNMLNGVAVLARNDVWAVGTTGLSNNQPLMLHWNGVSWKEFSGPQAPYASELSSVAGVASNDVWAVGSWGGSGPQTLAEHWNGTSWQIVSIPQGPIGGGALNGVVARAANDVWAVGYGVLSYDTGTSLTAHWNGTDWQVVKSPSPIAKGTNLLNAVTAVPGTSNLWAAGEAIRESAQGPTNSQYLIEEWSGSAWQVVPGLPGGTFVSNLNGVAATPDGDVWVVGDAGLTMAHAGMDTRAKLNCPPG